MTKKTDIKEQIWTALFLVTPVIVLGKLGDIYGDSSLNRILFAGLFGGLGGAVGAVFLHLSKSKSTFIKTSLVLLLIGICATTLVVSTKIKRSILQTCEICGYIAITSDKKECGYCGSLTWENQKKINGYDDKQEWLKDEQLLWFSLDSLTQPIDFYKPDLDEGFEKDKNWKPIINQQDLIDDFDDGK
ncbi:MAG: hypothetical protein MH472_07050 [Bacteroidia bacterium]|nr:hypothetical protein [Bacteroidia bacterium]